VDWFDITMIVFWCVAGIFFLKDLFIFTANESKTGKEFFKLLIILVAIIGSIVVFAYAPSEYIFYYIFFLITAYLFWLFAIR
jgi:hypothetical protein